MKVIFLMLFLTSVGCNICLGQTSNLEVSGFNQEPNIAYLGVGNRLEIAIYNTNKDKFEFVIANGEIINDKYGYVYIPEYLGETVISIKYKDIEGNNNIFTSTIQVDYLPFTFHLGGNHTFNKDSFNISKEHFLIENFRMESTNTNLSGRARILGFDLKIINKQEPISTKSYTNIYTKEVSEIIRYDIQNISAGSIIHIENLRYAYLENMSKLYKTIRVTIN